MANTYTKTTLHLYHVEKPKLWTQPFCGKILTLKKYQLYNKEEPVDSITISAFLRFQKTWLQDHNICEECLQSEEAGLVLLKIVA